MSTAHIRSLGTPDLSLRHDTIGPVKRFLDFVWLLVNLQQEINILATSIADVKADVAALKAATAAEIAAVQKKIADLAGQVAAGGVATQADLDALHSDLGGVITTLQGETDAVSGTPVPVGGV